MKDNIVSVKLVLIFQDIWESVQLVVCNKLTMVIKENIRLVRS